MRCVRVLVLLLLINICWAQVAQVDDAQERPQQQLAARRRRVSDLADVGTPGDVDVATPEEGDEETLSVPSRPSRPRNPNRRRRKRKRIPPPRPLYEDYEDTLAFPAAGERPTPTEHHERYREPPTGPEHRSLPQPDRRRLRGDQDDEDRPLRRERPRIRGEGPLLDREGQPSNQRPFREHPYLGEDGEPRPQRPLRRRRKNRRRPPIGGGPPDGIQDEPVKNPELHKEVPEEIPDKQEEDLTHHPEGNPPDDVEIRGRNRQIEDIPLGSLRGEVRLPKPPRQRNRTPVEESEIETDQVTTRWPQTTTPESLPAENLPSFNFDNHPPRQRRRRIRPRAQNKSTTEKTVISADDGEKPLPQVVDKMLDDREPLKLREEAMMVQKQDAEKDSFPAASSGKDVEDDVEVKDTSIVSGDITLQTTPIKISLSDLLREKNISIEEILKDADEEPLPRPQRPIKKRPPLPTPKTIVTPKLTQLSRVHQFLQRPSQDHDKEDDSEKVPESKSQDREITTSTTHRSHTQTTPSTHRTNPSTTTRKFTPTTPTTQRFYTTTTARGISTTTGREGITRRTDKEITEKVVGRPVGFGSRAPALNMQETEDIDPVKMTGKPTSRVGNSKAAEFLKSRVRLPPSSVLFPSVKAGQGLRGGQPVTAPDQEPLPTRVTSSVSIKDSTSKGSKTTSEAPTNTESNKIPVPVIESDAVLTHTHVPVYVLNPKYYKASQPKTEPKSQTTAARPTDTLSPTETNTIPETEKSTFDKVNVDPTHKTDARSSTTESFSESQMSTDADPVRLNIPLKSSTEENSSEKELSHGKSAEDEIVELLETENGSSRLSRILASRNMTLTELIEHRERGASQQHISDIFLRNEESKETTTVHIEEPNTKVQTPLNINTVPKIEDVFNVLNTPAKKLNVEIMEEEDDGEENSKRVPRVFEGLAPFKPKGDEVPELEYKDSYPQSSLEIGTDYVIETYRVNGKHENPGKVREIVTKISDDDHDDFVGLPSGMRSAILASSAVLGLAIFVFLAIFVTCKVRRRQSIRRRYANRSPILSHDVEKSRSMTPVLRHSGYKDMTEERRYYLWNTIRKTLRYK